MGASLKKPVQQPDAEEAANMIYKEYIEEQLTLQELKRDISLIILENTEKTKDLYMCVLLMHLQTPVFDTRLLENVRGSTVLKNYDFHLNLSIDNKAFILHIKLFT
jgi:hypothetical protein